MFLPSGQAVRLRRAAETVAAARINVVKTIWGLGGMRWGEDTGSANKTDTDATALYNASLDNRLCKCALPLRIRVGACPEERTPEHSVSLQSVLHPQIDLSHGSSQ